MPAEQGPAPAAMPHDALSIAGAYCGAPPLPGALSGRWNADPVLVLALATAAVLAVRAPGRHRAAGIGAVGLLALLFLTPLCALSVALFSVRTAQHLAIILLVCPLLALSVHRPAAPRPGGLGVATAAHAAAIWAWHIPPLYSLALSSSAAYWALQLALIVSGLAFWRALAGSAILPAVGALAAVMVQMGVLGALLTFAPLPLYAPHLDSTLAWGLSPLADQSLSGLLMWVVSLPAYLLAALWICRPAFDDTARMGRAWRS